MNFEEYCKVFLTTEGSNRQVDADILAKCTLMAKQKNRLAAEFGKITIDTPIPYLLSDLTTILQNEMGKMDKATDTALYLRLRSKIDEIKADLRAMPSCYSACWYRIRWRASLAASFASRRDGKPRSRSSTFPTCRARSPAWWSRC